MKELVQKKGKEFRKYAFGKYGLNAETLVLDCHQSKFIKYEDIGFNETITKKSPSIYKILLVVSLFFNLILIFLILALVVGGNLFQTGNTYIFRNHICCFINIPDKNPIDFQRRKTNNRAREN